MWPCKGSISPWGRLSNLSACGMARPFAALFRPVGAGISLINFTHGVAVGYLISPLRGCNPLPGGTVNRPRLAVFACMPAYGGPTCMPSLSVVPLLICVYLWFHSSSAFICVYLRLSVVPFQPADSWHYSAPLGLAFQSSTLPTALPWAILYRPSGAASSSQRRLSYFAPTGLRSPAGWHGQPSSVGRVCPLTTAPTTLLRSVGRRRSRASHRLPRARGGRRRRPCRRR